VKKVFIILSDFVLNMKLLMQILTMKRNYEMIDYETYDYESLQSHAIQTVHPMHANTPPHTMQKMHMQPNASARIPHDTVMNQNEYK